MYPAPLRLSKEAHGCVYRLQTVKRKYIKNIVLLYSKNMQCVVIYLLTYVSEYTTKHTSVRTTLTQST